MRGSTNHTLGMSSCSARHIQHAVILVQGYCAEACQPYTIMPCPIDSPPPPPSIFPTHAWVGSTIRQKQNPPRTAHQQHQRAVPAEGEHFKATGALERHAPIDGSPGMHVQAALQ